MMERLFDPGLRRLLVCLLVVAVAGACAAGRVEQSSPPPSPPPTPPPAEKPASPAKLLLPPATPGESRTEITGCLADPSAAERGATRSPTSPAPGTPQVRVTPMARGVLIAHELSHACCLSGAVESRLEGSKLVVTERLSGMPCRCMCASTLRTAVGLSPGTYELVLQVEEGGRTRVVDERSFTVGG